MRGRVSYSRLFIALAVIFFLGTVSVFAGNIIVNEDGIQANYYSEDGNAGITFNLSVVGVDGQNYTIVYENGVVVSVTNYSEGGEGGSFPSTGLVSYYKLDETSGTTTYDEYSSNDGSITGASIQQTGKINYGYDFEQTETDYVTLVDSALRMSGSYTASAWFKSESISTTQVILVKYGHYNGHTNYNLYLYDGYLKASRYNSHDGSGGTCNSADVLSSTGTLSSDQWYLATLTFDTSTKNLSLYLNGELQQSVTTAYPISCYNWVAQDGIIGAAKTTAFSNSYFDGIIDEVGIWNRALSSSEVAELYNSGSGVTYSS